MAQTTEAACLLQTGNLYTRRLGLWPRSGDGPLVFAGLKHGAFSLYFGDEPIYHFDLEGRWQRAFVSGMHYLKGLDTATVAIERVREGGGLVLRRRALSFAAMTDLDASVRSVALDLIEAVNTGRLEPIEPPPQVRPLAVGELRGLLEDVARWDASAWFAHRERYLGTYGPLSFLPPEGQQAAVLQAALGDAEGITFGLAPAAEFYVRSPAEFAEHTRTVAALLGKRILQCRSLYLAGGAVLHQSLDELDAYLEAAAQTFPIDPVIAKRRLIDLGETAPRLEGVFAFLDRFEPSLPDRTGWARLRALHLNRVVLGVESGDSEVRALYGKRWENDALQALVADLKAAGMALSLVLLAGAGGREHAERHVDASAELINALELGPGDLVYLLGADEVGGDSARQRLQARGITPLPGPACLEQQAQLKARLTPVHTRRGAKVAPYSLEKQWA